MKPTAASFPVVAAPGSQADREQAAAAVPTSTSVGQPAHVAAPQFPRPQARPVPFAPPPSVADTLGLAGQPPAPAPTPEPVERPDRSLRVGQILCWQLAIVLIGAATTGSRLVLILTSLFSLTLILVTAIRFRGQWLYRWAGIVLAFLVRRRRTDLSGAGPLKLVSLFCGPTTAATLTVREQPYGLLSRPSGASVTLRLGPDARHTVLPQLGALADAGDEQPVRISVQLVLHTGVKGDRTARAWVAVRAERTAEIATDEQLSQVLANTVRRMVRRLDRDHVGTLPLEEADVLASAGALAHANAGRGHLRERWSTWAAGPVLQVCIRLVGYASLPPVTAQALVDTLLGTATGGAQTLAVTADSSATPHDAVLRIAASHPATLDTAVTVLTTLAESFGVEPERLDGRHASGVAATLPLGVPLS